SSPWWPTGIGLRQTFCDWLVALLLEAFSLTNQSSPTRSRTQVATITTSLPTAAVPVHTSAGAGSWLFSWARSRLNEHAAYHDGAALLLCCIDSSPVAPARELCRSAKEGVAPMSFWMQFVRPSTSLPEWYEPHSPDYPDMYDLTIQGMGAIVTAMSV